MKRCDHDQVFSGQINLSQRFAWICIKCGDQGWSEDYVLAQVNLELYHHLRVLHGWATPRLPSPPRVPTNTTTPPKPDGYLVIGVIFFTVLAAICALSGVPWGALGPIMPLWMALLSSGVALGTAALLYVVWKAGSNG